MLYAIVSSPPCSLVLQFSGHATAHPSGFAHFSDSSPYSLLFTRHLSESFQLYTCLPSCHLLLGGSLQPRSAIPLRSAHPELHLLPSNLLQLHLQLLPHPHPAVTQSTSLVPHPAKLYTVYILSCHVSMPSYYAVFVTTKIKLLKLLLLSSHSVPHLGPISKLFSPLCINSVLFLGFCISSMLFCPFCKVFISGVPLVWLFPLLLW